MLCAVEPGRTTIDARVVMTYQEPAADGLGVILEQVEIDIGEVHLRNLDSVIDPIRAAEIREGTPLWCAHAPTSLTR